MMGRERLGVGVEVGGGGSYYHSLPSRDTQGINIYLLSHGHWGSNWFLASAVHCIGSPHSLSDESERSDSVSRL